MDSCWICIMSSDGLYGKGLQRSHDYQPVLTQKLKQLEF